MIKYFNLTNGFEVIKLGPGDIGAVFNVYRQCEDFLALGPESFATMTMVLSDIDTSEREGGVFCGIRNPEGTMVGIVDFILDGFNGQPSVAYISLLMIVAPFRDQGLGTQIIKLIEEKSRKERHTTAIMVSVQVNNPEALRFWKKNGYQVVGEPELRPDSTTVIHLHKGLLMEAKFGLM